MNESHERRQAEMNHKRPVLTAVASQDPGELRERA